MASSNVQDLHQPGWIKLLRQLLARTFTSATRTESVVPSTLFLRSPWTSTRIFVSFILASLPAGLISAWQAQGQILQYLTLLLVALVVAATWELLFARWRARSPESTWLMIAWLFTILLPPSTSPWLAAIALSFGVVVGAHIFGGTGKYLVSPVLLGVLFLHFSYPGVIASTLPLPEPDISVSWLLACALGAAYLVYAGAISWRVLVGGVLGLVVASGASIALIEDNAAAGLSWYEHLAIGNFAFVLAFVATDPNAGPMTRLGRWFYGITIGLLTVAIRVLDPSHPEGTLFAALLAALSVPLFDYLVLRRHISPTEQGASRCDKFATAGINCENHAHRSIRGVILLSHGFSNGIYAAPNSSSLCHAGTQSNHPAVGQSLASEAYRSSTSGSVPRS